MLPKNGDWLEWKDMLSRKLGMKSPITAGMMSASFNLILNVSIISVGCVDMILSRN